MCLCVGEEVGEGARSASFRNNPTYEFPVMLIHLNIFFHSNYPNHFLTSLKDGLINGIKMQAYEAHIPYLLKFTSDMNIAPMNWIELEYAKVRRLYTYVYKLLLLLYTYITT